MDLANDVYIVMYDLSINKLTKILYDGGFEAYIYFVCRSEVNKYKRHIKKYVDLLPEISTNSNLFEKFYTLNDEDIKFICILATSDTKGELYDKLPRRYCDNMINKLKEKLI